MGGEDSNVNVGTLSHIGNPEHQDERSFKRRECTVENARIIVTQAGICITLSLVTLSRVIPKIRLKVPGETRTRPRFVVPET